MQKTITLWRRRDSASYAFPTSPVYPHAVEPGAWYEPSITDKSMSQDSGGSTALAAAGDPVGLFLDKRYGFAKGSNIVLNGEFIGGDATGWTLVPGATVETERLRLDSPASNVISSYAHTLGNVYAWEFSISDYVSGVASFYAGGGTRSQAAANGTYRGIFTATSSASVRFLVAAGLAAYADNIKVQSMGGSLATQPVATARPVYRANPARVEFDVGDSLQVVFPSALGADCTIGYAVPGVGAVILTAQTIGTTYTITSNFAAYVIVGRSLTSAEAGDLTAYLNKKAGV